MDEKLQKLQSQKRLHIILSVIFGIIVYSRLSHGLITTIWGTLINFLAIYVFYDEVRKAYKNTKDIKRIKEGNT